MGRRSRRDPDAHRERGKGHPTRARQELRRPVLQRPAGTDEYGTVAAASNAPVAERAADFEKASERISRQPWKRGLYEQGDLYQVVRLAEDGIDWGAAPGTGDEVGYCMAAFRGDDCLQAAIATATQVPIEAVPDLDLARRLEAGGDPEEISADCWDRLDRWAAARGTVMAFHDDVPAPRDRWVGVVTWQPFGVTPEGFSDHCLVMSHDRLVFDPSCGVQAPRGMAAMHFSPDRITYGISFDREE